MKELSPKEDHQEKQSARKQFSAQKWITFSLMLTLPVALAGCSSSKDCVDNNNDGYCDESSGGSGGAHYYGGGSSSSKSSSSSYKSSSSSSSKGFGSGGLFGGSGG